MFMAPLVKGIEGIFGGRSEIFELPGLMSTAIVNICQKT